MFKILTNVRKACRCLHEKQKVGLAFASRVNFPAGPTFLNINSLARPIGSSRSRRDVGPVVIGKPASNSGKEVNLC